MKAKDILAVKGSRVITIHQDNKIMDAVDPPFSDWQP